MVFNERRRSCFSSYLEEQKEITPETVNLSISIGDSKKIQTTSQSVINFRKLLNSSKFLKNKFLSLKKIEVNDYIYFALIEELFKRNDKSVRTLISDTEHLNVTIDTLLRFIYHYVDEVKI